jgi:D-amino-acid oxidase
MSESPRPMAEPDIIVIGGGVSGLSCAHELALARKRVQVWTAVSPDATTSRVAAAFWHPYRADPIERVGPWAAVSYERFASMASDPTIGPAAGVYMRDAIELFVERVPDPPWSRYVDMFRHAVPEELPTGFVHGIVWESPVIEMPRYLAWLVERLRRLGVEIVTSRLDTLAPALERARVVVNCSGLGARELVSDSRMYAVRGQIVRRRRHMLDRIMVADRGVDGISYIVPRDEDVVLGGTADVRDESLAENPAQSESIVERCIQLEPALAQAEQLGVSVGLRPCRDVVRLEQEQIDGKLVVHDYGHGGAGVTLSWGCAEDVRDRVLAWRG